MEHVVVVGGGLAGARTCEQLRLQGFPGRITLLTAEAHRPYDRPPLSKDVLLGRREDTTLPVDLESLDVAVRLESPATALCTTARTVTAGSADIAYDGLVIATGATPVRLPGDGEQHTIRSIDDARALRSRLQPGVRVVVVGAGWIGAEVATAALASGCSVTCIEAGAVPGESLLGREVGARLSPWWHGAELRTGTGVRAVVDGGVVLGDGDWVPADVVVTGVGCRPATEWLDSSQVHLDRGVLVDEWLRAAPGVVAVGDVAAWWSRRSQRRMRVEHWDNAVSGAIVAAGSLLDQQLRGSAATYDPLPYFWSDQFGHKLQYIGAHDPADDVLWREHPSGAWTAVWVDDHDRMKAALVADLPRDLVQARLALTAGLTVDRRRIEDPATPISRCGTAEAALR